MNIHQLEKPFAFFVIILSLLILSFISISVDEIAPEIELPDVNGDTLRLTELRGNIVLITFWATWCSASNAIKNPEYNLLYNKYKDYTFENADGFTVYSVAFDSDKEKWKRRIKDAQLDWPNHVIDQDSYYSYYWFIYNIKSIPTSFLIDETGRVIGTNMTFSQLENELNKRKRAKKVKKHYKKKIKDTNYTIFDIYPSIEKTTLELDSFNINNDTLSVTQKEFAADIAKNNKQRYRPSWELPYLKKDSLIHKTSSSHKEKPLKNRNLTTSYASKIAPEVELPNINGDTLRLTELKGNIVLITFWATWCAACNAIKNPEYSLLYNKYKDYTFENADGFTVYSVAFESDKEKWKRRIKDAQLDWPNHVIDQDSYYSYYWFIYNISSVPSSFLLDETGRVIGANMSFSQLDNELNRLKRAKKIKNHNETESPKNISFKLFNSYLSSSIGDIAPEIELPNLNGDKLKLSESKGKIVLVNFWSIHCDYCNTVKNPEYRRLYDEYKDSTFENADGFTIYSVVFEDNINTWKYRVEDELLDWPNHVIDQNFHRTNYLNIPSSFLLDEMGRIIGINMSYNQLDDELKRMAK